MRDFFYIYARNKKNRKEKNTAMKKNILIMALAMFLFLPTQAQVNTGATKKAKTTQVKKGSKKDSVKSKAKTSSTKKKLKKNNP